MKDGTPSDAVSRDVVRRLEEVRVQAGLAPVEGPGLVVTLDDAKTRDSPSGNLNDIVVHSQDVQAVANGLWVAGAEAIAVNRQRVVSTSALLCVGNTLLINGTVHSPPYRFVAIGDAEEMKDQFMRDPLVRAFADDADRFGLGFSVVAVENATIPSYQGSTALLFARK